MYILIHILLLFYNYSREAHAVILLIQIYI
jgi:hypothetical protein